MTQMRERSLPYLSFLLYKEKIMNLMQLLASDSYIVVNKDLVRVLGLEQAVLIGELCSEYTYWKKLDKLTDDGFFYSTIENVETQTGIKEKQQRRLLNELKSLGIITLARKGLPAKRYIKINEECLFSQFGQNDRSTSIKNDRTAPVPETELYASGGPINNNKYNNTQNSTEYINGLYSETTTPSLLVEPKNKKEENVAASNRYSKKQNNVLEVGQQKKPSTKKSKPNDDYDVYINAFSTNTEVRSALTRWQQYRESRGPYDIGRFNSQLSDLSTLAHTDEDMIKIVDRAIATGYLGFFPLDTKSDTKENNNTAPEGTILTPSVDISALNHERSTKVF